MLRMTACFEIEIEIEIKIMFICYSTIENGAPTRPKHSYTWCWSPIACMIIDPAIIRHPPLPFATLAPLVLPGTKGTWQKVGGPPPLTSEKTPSGELKKEVKGFSFVAFLGFK